MSFSPALFSLSDAQSRHRTPRAPFWIFGWMGLAALWMILSVHQAQRAFGGESVGCDRSNDEVWEICTRGYSQCASQIDLDQPAFKVSRWTPKDGWTSSSFEQYLASVRGLEQTEVDTTVTNTRHDVIYVHGNWMPADLTRERGLLVYRRLAQRAQTSLRLTYLSWPSQRERRPIQNIRENAAEAEVQGLYLAAILKQLPTEKPVGLLGFSLGSRAVTGALHMMAGGTLLGRTIGELPSGGRIYRVSLVAPAIDRNWLISGQRHGKALTYVDNLINLYNSDDPVLQRFRFIDTLSNPVAAGYSGFFLPRANRPISNDPKITQYDCGSMVGSTHDERTYYNKCCHFRIAIDNVLWNNS